MHQTFYRPLCTGAQTSLRSFHDRSISVPSKSVESISIRSIFGIGASQRPLSAAKREGPCREACRTDGNETRDTITIRVRGRDFDEDQIM